MKRYKLLKDLPTFKAGDEFELRDDGCLYWVDTGIHLNAHWKSEIVAYHRKTIARFPNILADWFEEIKSGKYYCLCDDGEIWAENDNGDGVDEQRKQIGNYFETKEEAELALRKLKAWKRLKDKGFKFCRWNKGNLWESRPNNIEFACDDATRSWTWEDIQEDLDLLFGGEE